MDYAASSSLRLLSYAPAPVAAPTWLAPSVGVAAPLPMATDAWHTASPIAPLPLMGDLPAPPPPPLPPLPAPPLPPMPVTLPVAPPAYQPMPSYQPAPVIAPIATPAPVFVPMPAPAVTPAPTTAPAPTATPTQPAAPAVHKPTRGPRASFKTQFKRIDTNDSGVLSRAEVRKGDGGSFKVLDRKADGKVKWSEYLAAKLSGGSFKGLDQDRDGVLTGGEISAIVTPSGTAFDKDGNGRVTRSEFLAARKRDTAAVRSKSAGAKHAKRRNILFQVADRNDDGMLRGKEVAAFKAYDRNRNQAISKKEFVTGQKADRERAARSIALEGRVGGGVARRMRVTGLGEARKLPSKHVKIDAAKVAALLGSPVENVKRAMPGIMDAMNKAGFKDRAAIIAMLATIRTEVGSFLPIHEYGGPGYWARYNNRSDLGNRPGTNDGVTYHGRGYIQLTGRGNYGTYGRAIGVDLVNHPDRALRPGVAARVLTSYFKARGVADKARAGDWLGARKAVNGGTNGWDTFSAAVQKLKGSKGWLTKGY